MVIYPHINKLVSSQKLSQIEKRKLKGDSKTKVKIMKILYILLTLFVILQFAASMPVVPPADHLSQEAFVRIFYGYLNKLVEQEREIKSQRVKKLPDNILHEALYSYRRFG